MHYIHKNYKTTYGNTTLITFFLYFTGSIFPTYILTRSPVCNVTSVSLFRGEKWQTQLFTDTHVGNAIPAIKCQHSVCLFFFLFFFFYSVLRPFQDYFSSYEMGQSEGGQKRENSEHQGDIATKETLRVYAI